MKKNLLYLTAAAIVAAVAFAGCEKGEEKTTTTTTTTTESNTWAKFTVKTSAGVVRPNYTVLMFDTPASQTAPLPAILKTAVSDAQGVAYLNLEDIVKSTISKTYYFIAVREQTNNYVWETPYMQQEVSLKKGIMHTSSIIVQ